MRCLDASMLCPGIQPLSAVHQRKQLRNQALGLAQGQTYAAQLSQ